MDFCDIAAVNDLFDKNDIDGVIHFAGHKSVAESIEQPLEYYRNNIDSSLNLLASMRTHDVRRFVFSSSATVYGNPSELPLLETSRTGVGITNPYGQTKYMIEQIIRDFSVAWPEFESTILRYFNPVGAHESGLIGEDPKDTPNNLMPYVAQTAAGRRSEVHVFGDTYDTVDGTGVRDYIHVVDLARGHVAAIEHLETGVEVYNLGTGRGASVLELIAAFSAACGHEVPYTIDPPRNGDIASCYANVTKAEQALGWKAVKSLEDACRDSWRWQSHNPDGYESNS